MKSSNVAIFPCLILAFFVGCGETRHNTESASPKPFVVTDAQIGTDVALAVGQELHIELKSNRTTGYSWDVESPADQVLQEVAKPEYVNAPNPNNNDGVGGIQAWRFRAVKLGAQTLKLRYSQGGQNEETDRLAEFRIVVK